MTKSVGYSTPHPRVSELLKELGLVAVDLVHGGGLVVASGEEIFEFEIPANILTGLALPTCHLSLPVYPSLPVILIPFPLHIRSGRSPEPKKQMIIYDQESMEIGNNFIRTRKAVITHLRNGRLCTYIDKYE